MSTPGLPSQEKISKLCARRAHYALVHVNEATNSNKGGKYRGLFPFSFFLFVQPMPRPPLPNPRDQQRIVPIYCVLVNWLLGTGASQVVPRTQSVQVEDNDMV